MRVVIGGRVVGASRARYREVARARSGRGEVVMRERHEDGTAAVLELRVNGVFVMDTAHTGSERALAERALGAVDDPAVVLVGGLGLGFTARAVLADDRVRRLVVVEMEEELVGWVRDGTIPHGPALLADDRLTVVVGDVRQAVARAAAGSVDLVLLDVDNGPGFLVHKSNAAVYSASFLTQVRMVLRVGGAVAVWSASPSTALEKAITAVFGGVRRIAHPVVLQGRPDAYWLYLGRC